MTEQEKLDAYSKMANEIGVILNGVELRDALWVLNLSIYCVMLRIGNKFEPQD